MSSLQRGTVQERGQGGSEALASSVAFQLSAPRPRLTASREWRALFPWVASRAHTPLCQAPLPTCDGDIHVHRQTTAYRPSDMLHHAPL